MQYFFLLGSNPALSFAELVSVLKLAPENVTLLTQQVAVIEREEELDIRALMQRLGGTIKAGTIRTTVAAHECTPELAADLVSEKASQSEGKFSFGFSFYGKTAVNKKQFGMEVKRLLKEQGVSPRWVVSKEKHLSSVVVEQNKLTTERGAELVFIPSEHGEEITIGETIAVQPFKELSKRDYGRPGRDDYSGMLPPKLAQMMINLAIPQGSANPTPALPLQRGGGGATPPVDNEEMSHHRPSPLERGRPGGGGMWSLLDPFCGSGTVLTEAMLMGVRDVMGTDSSKRAVADTLRNIAWTKERYPRTTRANAKAVHCDVRQLSRSVKKHSINAIVTEPYLGPSRMVRDQARVSQVKQELEQLYAAALRECSKVLAPGGRVVMVWPVFALGKSKKIWLDEGRVLERSSLVKINPFKHFPAHEAVALTQRQTFLYARQGQSVLREIIVLEKKPTHY